MRWFLTPRKHVITSTGNDAGKLLWYVNAAPQKPILLRFKAKYLDSRTNKVHRIMMDYSINCKKCDPLQADAAAFEW